MINIDWSLFLRQHIILGFFIGRKPTADDEEPGPMTIRWQWNWFDTNATMTNPVPWHRTWRWIYTHPRAR